MRLVCELLSAEGDGSIPMELFFEIYEYLCKIDGTISAKTINAVREYLDRFTSVSLSRDTIHSSHLYSTHAVGPKQCCRLSVAKRHLVWFNSLTLLLVRAS